jgi:uncharacterized membrane protein HdeD (DUF308 family)
VADADGPGEPRDELPAIWWWAPLLGVVSLIAGVVMLVRPDESLETLAVVAGVLVLLDSAYELATSLRRSTEARGFSALIGVLGIVAGILLVRHPVETVTAIGLILGIWLTGAGSLHLAGAITQRDSRWEALLGGVQMVAGVVILSSPGIGLATLGLLAGIAFLLNGVVLIGMGTVVRRSGLLARDRRVHAGSAPR